MIGHGGVGAYSIQDNLTSGSVDVLVRPEGLTVAAAEGGNGIVSGRTFLGAITRVAVLLSGDTEVRVDLASAAALAIPPGTSVQVGLPPTPVLVAAASSDTGFPGGPARHNCPCPDCRDPVTGQRLLKITDIPNGLVATVTAQHDTEIVVTFDPGGHRSVFRRDWLAAQAPAAQGGAVADPRTEDGKVLWRAADLAAPHTADWAAYTSDDRVREGCLAAVARYGCALLRGVPVSPGMMLEVAATFGYVRETNYGRLFDVRVEPDPDCMRTFPVQRIIWKTKSPLN